MVNSGFDHHFQGEFHAGRSKPESQDGIPPEAPQAAIEIPAWRSVQCAADLRQQRVAEIAMQRRHRLRLDATSEAVSEYQVIAAPQFPHKRLKRREIVAIIG